MVVLSKEYRGVLCTIFIAFGVQGSDSELSSGSSLPCILQRDSSFPPGHPAVFPAEVPHWKNFWSVLALLEPSRYLHFCILSLCYSLLTKPDSQDYCLTATSPHNLIWCSKLNTELLVFTFCLFPNTVKAVLQLKIQPWHLCLQKLKNTHLLNIFIKIALTYSFHFNNLTSLNLHYLLTQVTEPQQILSIKISRSWQSLTTIKNVYTGTSLVVPWLRLQAPNTGGPDSIPGQGTNPHKLQQKTPHTSTKTQCSQINKYF